MRKTIATLSALLALLSAGTALADEKCSTPMTDWQPREAVVKFAESKGWKVRRIRIDDGCYAVDGRDAQGRKIEAALDPATLEVIEIEYGDGEGDDD